MAYGQQGATLFGLKYLPGPNINKGGQVTTGPPLLSSFKIIR